MPEVVQNLFFREVTLRLCSSLDIEEGLKHCLRYIREFMPADALYLERYEPDLNAMRMVARATSDRAERMDELGRWCMAPPSLTTQPRRANPLRSARSKPDGRQDEEQGDPEIQDEVPGEELAGL